MTDVPVSQLVLLPLNALIAQVLMEIKNEEFVKWPGKIRPTPSGETKTSIASFTGTMGTTPMIVFIRNLNYCNSII